jgi:hypothetical protein
MIVVLFDSHAGSSAGIAFWSSISICWERFWQQLLNALLQIIDPHVLDRYAVGVTPMTRRKKMIESR